MARPMYLLLALALLLVAAPAADAAQPSGAPVATMPIGAKGKGLRSDGVRVTATGKAKVYDTWVGFPVSDVSVGAKGHATLIFSGGLKLRKGSSSVAIRGLLVKIDGRAVTVTGKIGSKRLTVFSGRAASAPKLDNARQAIDLSVAGLELTRPASTALRKRIRSFTPKSRRLGRLRAIAYVKPPALGGDQTTSQQEAYKCHAVAGPSSDPAKPLTAVNVSCAALVWHLRDSWISYIDDTVPIPPATGLPAIEGKDHVCPDGGANKATTYSFSLPPLSGWWDPVSGTGDLVSSGGVRSTGLRASVTIDIQVSNVELKLKGASSELWADVWTRNSGEPEYNQRVLFATLNGTWAPGAAPARARMTLTNEGAAAFKMYGAGDGFGCVDLGFDF